MHARQIVCLACLIAFLPRMSSLNQLLHNPGLLFSPRVLWTFGISQWIPRDVP